MYETRANEMCKEMGVYPKCQCPGFAGQPADADDNRSSASTGCRPADILRPRRTSAARCIRPKLMSLKDSQLWE